MKVRYVRVLALLFAIAILAGCRSALIQNVESVPISLKKQNYTEEDIGKMIMKAGATTKWRLEEEKPGVILAHYYGPLEDGKIAYSAAAAINYSKGAYSIRYRDSSENLKYGPGEIHENYNEWVKKLDDAIRLEMLVE